jgi:hypothetical protein
LELVYRFSATFKSIRDVIARVDAAGQRVEQARLFSGQANLQRISVWSRFESASTRPRVQHAVTADGRTLINPKSGDRWSVPATLALPALPKLEELRRVLGG